MGLVNKLAQYRAWKSGVKHCTFNPDGPGVVRIHLLPPKLRLFGSPRWLVILNGYYLLPLGDSWAVMLSHFMEEVNRFDGREIGEAEGREIVSRAVRATCRDYPLIGKRLIREDLDELLDVLFAIAHGEHPDVQIEKLSIRSYAKHMYAPHRMDLMVSAMTDAEGHWKCNQKCLFCYAAGQTLGESRELSGDEWKRIIDKLRAAGVPMLTFTGGEPTLREDLPELIAHARWFVTRLNTNGVCLTETLVKRLKEASLDSAQITLYSHDGDIHNELVGSRHFADTVKGIRTALENGLDISVNTPLCRKNADYVQTLSFLHGLGVRFVTASGLICTGMAEETHGSYDLDAQALAELLRDAKRFCDAHGMELDFTSPGLVPNETLREIGLNVPSCGAALSNMAIAPDGTVIPCQSWLAGDAGLGNLLTEKFSSVWSHPLCRKLRSMSDGEALSCPFRCGHCGGKEA